MNDFPAIIAKYGVNGLLCVVCIWMNNRLEKVEQRLYNCLENKEIRLMQVNKHKETDTKHILIAVMPSKTEEKEYKYQNTEI